MKERWRQSLISNKYPPYRDTFPKAVRDWITGKQEDDNAEGLWRIHDTLYDFTDFVKHHPGGSYWLSVTKGTDITELFEAHHISEVPEQLIKKYKIRETKEPRNITLTLQEDGFYRTLKRHVRDELKTIDQRNLRRRSDLIHTTLLVTAYVLCIISAAFDSKILALVAGLFVTWTVIVAHNYFHRKDNWRMYTFNLALMNFNEWRISHAMSHHMFPNSYHDLEMSLFEPMLCWIPNPNIKNFVQRYVSWIYSPLIYTVLGLVPYTLKLVRFIVKGVNLLYWDDLIPLTIPAAMFFTTNAALSNVLILWLIILLSAGFLFGLIGLNAAHHHPEIVHDGDTMRDNRDWGLYQIDTIIDRKDVKGSQFLVLTHFGEHILHHLFPTLDHGVLPQLNSTLYETMADFEGEMRECGWIHHIVGQFKQLARIAKNPNPPGHEKNKQEYLKENFICAHERVQASSKMGQIIL